MKICENCNKKTEKLYYYVDENNINITKHSKGMCKNCYEKIYKIKISETPMIEFYNQIYDRYFR